MSALPTRYALSGATLVDPIGGARAGVDLLVEDGRIAAIEPTGRLSDAVPRIDASGRYVVPGMVDVHTHVSYRSVGSPYDFDLRRSLPEVTADGLWNARVILRAGFTSVRDCGSPPGVATAIKRAIDGGEAPGPAMQVAGQVISGVGGLGDMHPSHLFADNSYATAMARLVKDPWDARNALRRQAKDGVEWFKVTLSGTAANPSVPAERDDLGGDLFEAIAEEALLLGIPIIAHAESAHGAERAAATRATRTIEHGVHLTDRAIELMLEHDITLVPTLAQYTTWAERGEELGRSAASMRAHRRVHPSHLESVRRAVAAGVRVAVGGDAGGLHFPQGSAAQELGVLREAIGMPPQDVLRAATVHGARVLGREDEIGRLEPGFTADLVVLSEDPLARPEALAEPERFTAVVQRGIVVAGGLA